MHLERMLEKCHRDQWRLEDLDWDRPPRALTPAEEIRIVQLFTDMSAIEQLAGALFEEQRNKTDDPLLKQIFTTFVVDERRHAAVATRLAAFYNRHHYRDYAVNLHLQQFVPHFLYTVRRVTPEIANVYVTVGELLLDVALLRSINDYVHDDMSQAAMNLINRDESRHIAIDYHMIEYYASEEYEQIELHLPPRSRREQLEAGLALSRMFYYARPFFEAVFFEPLDVVDPTGRRMVEAFKRAQLVSTRPRVAARPIVRFLMGLIDLLEHPVAGPTLRPLLLRILGLDERVARRLYDKRDAERAQKMSMQELAEEALRAKEVN